MEGTIGLVERISTACPDSSSTMRKLFIAAIPCFGAGLVVWEACLLGAVCGAAGSDEFWACRHGAKKRIAHAAQVRESRRNLRQDGDQWDEESVGGYFTAALGC